MEQKVRPGAGDIVRVPYDGFYVMGTLLLTGEQRTGYSQQIFPRRPFDPTCGCRGLGAWELVGRASWIQAGDVVFAPGAARLADPSLFSNAATEMTLGFNWYLERLGPRAVQLGARMVRSTRPPRPRPRRAANAPGHVDDAPAVRVLIPELFPHVHIRIDRRAHPRCTRRVAPRRTARAASPSTPNR